MPGVINATSGLVFWMRGASVTGFADAASINTVTESSANTQVFTQATGANQPTYRTAFASLNNKPAISADGNDTLANATTAIDLIGKTGATFFFVFHTTTGGVLISRDQSGNRGFNCWIEGSNGKMQFYISNSSTGMTTREGWYDVRNRPSILTMRYAASTEMSIWHNKININGNLGGSIPASVGGTGADAYIFNDHYNYPFSGTIGEIAIFDRTLTDAERLAIEDDLMAEYLPPLVSDAPGVVYAFENFANGATATSLASTIDGVVTTLTVASSSGFPAPNFRVRLQNELMKVTGISGTTWTVERGAEGTAATSHVAGAAINFYLTAGAMQQWRKDQIMTGTFAARPSNGRQGMMYIPTNAPIVLRHNGVNWDHFGPCYSAKKPDLASLTKIESVSGFATVVEHVGGLFLSVPGGGGPRGVIFTRTGTWSKAVVGFQLGPRDGQVWSASILARETSTGKFKTGGPFLLDGTPFVALNNEKWDSVNVTNSSYYSFLFQLPRIQHNNERRIYLQLENAGSNIRWSWSSDGYNFREFLLVFGTDFCARDECGFMLFNDHATLPAILNVFHWDVTP